MGPRKGVFFVTVAVLLLSLLLSVSVSDAQLNSLSRGLTGAVLNGTQPLTTSVADITTIPGPILALIAANLPLINSGLLSALSEGNAFTGFSSGLVTALTTVLGALAKVAVPEAVGPDPDVEARRFGLIGDKYNITTEDGYILTAFRVRSKCTDPKRVVVIPQGILSNAAAFTLLQKDSLAYKLARQCSDVWLVSFRGSRWGRGHVTLSDKSNEFWDFDALEWGKYDLPANLEFISEVTGSRQLRLVGVDIAGTALFIMASEHGARYQQLLGRTYLFAPIAYLTHLRSPAFATLALGRDLLVALGGVALHNELPLWDPSVHTAFYLLCGRLSPRTCFYLFQLLGGASDEIAVEEFYYIARYTLDSTSVRALAFFLQLIGKDHYFSKYDFGADGNIERYGTAVPPAYNLNAVQVPCNFYVMGKSIIASPEDVTATFAALPRSVQQRIYTVPSYNAISPFAGVHPELLYDPVSQHIEEDFRTDGLPACSAICQ